MHAIWSLVVLCLAMPAKASERWVSGYYVGYQSSILPPDKVDLTHLTHILVGRILPRKDGSLDTRLDLDAIQGPKIAKLLAIKSRKLGKRALLFVGGAGEERGWQEATRKENIGKFVNNLVNLVTEWNYDGLDLDWEPIRPQDEAALLALVTALRKANSKLIISMPIGWINSYTEFVSPIYRQLVPYVDQLNIMSYGMANSWLAWQSWHSSALYGESIRTPSSVAASVQAYVKSGIPRHKIGVGAGFYGSCWAGGVTGPRQSKWSAKVIAADNEISFSNIKSRYYTRETYHFDSTAAAPYLASKDGLGPRRCTFLSFEDEASLKLKGEFIKKEGLGGAMIWTINQGYLAQEKDQNPLLNAIYQATR